MRARSSLAILCTATWASACSLVVDTTGLTSRDRSRDGATDGATDAATEPADADGDRGASTARCGDAGSDPALVLYLAFDEGTGTTAFDCSGRGHDGVIQGPAAWVPGHAGGALRFDGTATCIQVGATPALAQ